MSAGGMREVLPDLVLVLGFGGTLSLISRILLSWSRVGRETIFLRAVEMLTEPWVAPVRRHLPRVSGVDLPMWATVAFVAGGTILLHYLLS